MSMPTVSVIMNCYNSAAYLREALESVLMQSFQDWELIFWDNQSTDQSAEIFKEFTDSRFCYYRAEKHTKLGEARNLAVSHARGVWLAFLDCDDEWPIDKLEKQLGQAGCPEDEVGFIYGPVEYKISMNQKSSTSLEAYCKRMKITPHHARSIYHDLLLYGNMLIFSTLLIRRELYDRVGGVDSTLSQNEDYDLVLKASRISNAVCIEDVCAVYRIHASNSSHSQVELNYQENARIFAALPHDKVVEYALKLNASRYAVHKIAVGHILSGVKMLLLHGAPFWIIKRGYHRVIEGIWRI